jgi:hypothetical protein
VQIKDDGTHAILPVAAHVRCGTDHARMPVMWLRHADGKMRRDGSNAAAMQPNTAVDERGRVHSAEDPLLLRRIAFKRGAEGLVAREKGNENG